MSERRELALQVIDEVEKAVVGKRKILEKIMTAILAGGHILIEDIPGTGKTWGDVNDYHMILDTSELGVENCADILMHYFEKLEYI